MEALQIIKRSMLLLMNRFPILYGAIKQLKPKAYEEDEQVWKLCKRKNLEGEISTDGVHLWYTPEKVLDRYRFHGFEDIEGRILHVILHCLFNHVKEYPRYSDQKLIRMAMDRQVNHILLELGYYWYNSNAEENMNEYLGTQFDLGTYYRAKDDWNIRRKMITDGGKLRSDHHELWDPEVTKTLDFGTSFEEQQEKNCKFWESMGKALGGASADTDSISEELKENDQKGKYEMGRGIGSGDSVEDITAASENENSYYQTLMRFLRTREIQKEVPDAIDAMLYQYGLELYKDVPLIEPPESEEQLDLETICVAIDTSGSCSGEIASHFLRETQNILRDLSRLSPKCKFYFFECDYDIQKEECYERADGIPWEEWGTRQMWGWGGTSFVPVFRRVDELIDKEGKNVDCLIYLTDAYGDWPEEKPEYPVFFVLPQHWEEQKKSDYFPEWIETISLEVEQEWIETISWEVE